eukprot:tig00000215_g18590.t1
MAGGNETRFSITIPKALLDQAKAFITDSESVPFTMYEYRRPPYGAKNTTSAGYNVSTGATEISVPGGPAIRNLAEPVTFRLPFPAGFVPTPPIDLIYFNETTESWANCSSAVVEYDTEAGRWFAVGTCDHFTAFSLGIPAPAPALPVKQLATGDGQASFQTAAPEQSSGSAADMRAAIAAPTVIGFFLIVVVAIVIVYEPQDIEFQIRAA